MSPRRRRSRTSSAPSRTPTPCCSPLTRTARARPSRGTCSRCCAPRSPCSAWCSTRSPPRRSVPPSRTPVISTCSWWRPRRPVASSTGCTATPCPRCSGRRSAGRPSRPAGCSPSPSASSSTGSGSESRSGPLATGTWRACSGSGQRRPRQGPSTPGSRRSTGSASRPARTSTSRAPCARTPSPCSMRPVRRRSCSPCRAHPSPCAPWCRSPASASPRRRSSPRPFSRRPRTDCAGAASAPCGSPSRCTRTATSPTCAPTR